MFQRVLVVAIAVKDLGRAQRFWCDTLGMEPYEVLGERVGVRLGDAMIHFKEHMGDPTDEPNFRITLETADAYAVERDLKARGVRIGDAVRPYEGHHAGSFLDSEGNKFWFCSFDESAVDPKAGKEEHL